MQANSRVPTSAQTGIHENLAALLERHRRSPYLKPYADYNRAAFVESVERWQRIAPSLPLILDSCCGTGESSVVLARHFPGHYVIGVDQSIARLGRNIDARAEFADLPPNVDFVRADLVDYWRLLREAGIGLTRHFLLYPNPWPKIGHLSRRWHGHPVFPAMLELGGVLECRSNWRVYAEEFCFAVNYLAAGDVCQGEAVCEVYEPARAQTPFERKYLESGHTLYRVVAQRAGRTYLPAED